MFSKYNYYTAHMQLKDQIRDCMQFNNKLIPSIKIDRQFLKGIHLSFYAKK